LYIKKLKTRILTRRQKSALMIGLLLTPGSTKEYMKVMGDFSPYTEAKEYAKRLPKQSHVKKRDLFPAKIGQWFKDMQARKSVLSGENTVAEEES